MRQSLAMIRGVFWLKAGVVVLGALVLMGCASAIAIRVPPAGPDTGCVTPDPDRDVLVGVALSGGGSRAALFWAAGLEALGRLPAPGGGSVLEQIAYLSSVSGGSVAATAYASQKPPRETPDRRRAGRTRSGCPTRPGRHRRNGEPPEARAAARQSESCENAPRTLVNAARWIDHALRHTPILRREHKRKLLPLGLGRNEAAF